MAAAAAPASPTMRFAGDAASVAAPKAPMPPISSFSTTVRPLPLRPKNQLALPPPFHPKHKLALLAPVVRNTCQWEQRCPLLCSNDLAAFSLDNCCIKWVWLDGGAWLSLACAPFRSARTSVYAWLLSAASRWSCNSHPTL